jgi:hypothetical protein
MPKALYADDRNWVAPLLFERLHHLDPRKNPFFDHAEAAFWFACKDGRPVGRISAQADRAHIELHDAATGHFGFLEAEDDPEVFRLLLATAEDWLRERNLSRVLGPFSLSINDGPCPAVLRPQAGTTGIRQGQGSDRLRLRPVHRAAGDDPRVR